MSDVTINDNKIARKLDYMRMRTPIMDQCEGERNCDKIIEESDQKFCKSYLHPDIKWRLGICNAATHVTLIEQAAGKKRVGQQKQSKKKKRR